jgi:hypothetical protein
VYEVVLFSSTIGYTLAVQAEHFDVSQDALVVLTLHMTAGSGIRMALNRLNQYSGHEGIPRASLDTKKKEAD